MRDTDWPAEDLRARLAAEATLAQKQTELATANTKIAAHAKQLTDEIIVKRQEAESLRGENLEVRSHLEKAESAMRLAERRLWDSLDAIEDGFAVFDGDNRLIAANRA
ncbi:MAG: hybrid sensor histidine kinase/response regulator, partial [Alphaproteobacteria bacterium]|nr:hybrid sensor histidine kinase/response regulator [Alphaproteobacteria bacterium]